MVTRLAKLASFTKGLEEERQEILRWLTSIKYPQSECANVSGYLIRDSEMPRLSVGALRALRDRVLSGEKISLTAVGGVLASTDSNEHIDAVLRVAPIREEISPTVILYAVRGLDMYELLDEELNGEHWQQNSMLLVEAVWRLFSVGGSGTLLKVGTKNHGTWNDLSLPSEETASLILSRPDRFEDIMDIITERWITDAELITAILDSDAKPLSAGQL